MSENKILDKKFYDKAVICPNCSSSNVNLRYRCPKCKSVDISTKALAEHIKCGAIDTIERFQKGNELECFKCKTIIKKNDPKFRNVGTWFHCSSCDSRFDEPFIIQHCMNCNKDFSTKDAKLDNLHSYVLNEDVQEEYERELALILLLRPELEKLKLKTAMMGSLKGKSGKEYTFDLVAYDNGKKKPTVVDIIIGSEAIGTSAISNMFTKIYDVKPKRQIIIAIPKLNEESIKLSELYKIESIEAENIEEATRKLIAFLKGADIDSIKGKKAP